MNPPSNSAVFSLNFPDEPKKHPSCLGYEYLGNWEERENNRNVEPELLRAWLGRQGHADALIAKVLHELERAAGDTSKSLYDRNRAVYDLLRYGVKVRPDVGENNVTVWVVDWKNAENNDFAIAEEVTVTAANTKAHGKRPDIVLYVNGIAPGVLELKRSTVSVSEGIRQMKAKLPPNFKPKWTLYVFVDECHRTNSGKLHEAMKEILPGAVFIGFTGTPLLKDDKQRSIEVFGGYIHTYKFDEAVKDKVVLDLRYEAHLIERHHNDRFIAILDKHLPQWRVSRAELNASPLSTEEWLG